MIRQIFHLADIHIRRGNVHESRFSEYDTVIDETVREIAAIHLPAQCLCVICGDLFHHKLQISSHGIVLFNKLVTLISGMMPLIIIQGNHDLIQENDDRNNDLIRALVENINRPHVRYFDRSGAYEWSDQIHFGIVSIRDMLKANVGSGLVDDLPPFPPPAEGKLNVALSHATVKGFKLNSYKTANHGVPLEWFTGYQLLLLGDIHLQSAKYNKLNHLYYGYPGSLVQQDYGEPVFNHGFLVWNITEDNTVGEVQKVHVHNRVARGNLRVVDGVPVINASGDYIPVDDFVRLDKLPEELFLRLWATDSCDPKAVREHVERVLREKSVSVTINVASRGHCDGEDESLLGGSGDGTMFEINYDSINSTDTLVEFFRYGGKEASLLSNIKYNDQWERFLRNVDYVKMMGAVFDAAPPQLREKIDKKNEKLSAKIEASRRDTHQERTLGGNVLRIEKVEFDWILAFGKRNRFVFADNSLTLINASNGYGKSAFFECIVLGLFGAPIPSRMNRATTLSILNRRRPKNQVSHITVDFRINDTPYTVRRDFGEYADTRNKTVTRLHSNTVELYEHGKLIKSGAKLVNAWIEANLCTLKDFLLSTMITQNFDNDFFKLRDIEQKELLDSVLNMKSINSIGDVFKEAKKEYKDLKSHIETFVEAIKPDHIFAEDKYETLRQSCESLETHMKEKQAEFDALCVPLPKTTLRVRDDLVEPSETLEQLMQEESALVRELDKLDQDPSHYEHGEYELMDIDREHLEDTEFLLQAAERHTIQLARVDAEVDKHLPKMVAVSLKDHIVWVREAKDRLDYSEMTLENVRSGRPPTPKILEMGGVDAAEARYDTFQKEFLAAKKRFKKLKHQDAVLEPDFDIELDLVCPDVPDRLLTMDDDELLSVTHRKDASHGLTEEEHAYNPDCWACHQNFDSGESLEARQLLEYRRKVALKERWERYLQNKGIIDRYAEMKTGLPMWEAVVAEINEIRRWDEKHAYAASDARAKVSDLAVLSKLCLKVFDRQTMCNKARGVAAALKQVREKREYFVNQKLRLKYAIESANTQLIDQRANMTRLELLRDREIEYNRQKVGLEELLDTVKTRLDLFAYFGDTLQKYKAWIYNEKLLPAIVRKTNTIVNHMFQNRRLILQFKYVENNVVFTVVDEGNSIHMEKLSGAQAFAVSLSFRLALSAVGISRFRCNQLFIDEGFCSFDQNNLLNVPALMRNLTSLFSEILLVTHLDEIKSCADRVVNIGREDGVSTLWCDREEHP